MFKIISIQIQLCLGEFKAGQNRFQMKKVENNKGRKQICIQYFNKPSTDLK